MATSFSLILREAKMSDSYASYLKAHKIDMNDNQTGIIIHLQILYMLGPIVQDTFPVKLLSKLQTSN